MAGEKRAPRNMVCPRCGKDAEVSFPDSEKRLVDVNCTHCGSFQASREECREALEEMETEDNQTRTPG